MRHVDREWNCFPKRTWSEYVRPWFAIQSKYEGAYFCKVAVSSYSLQIALSNASKKVRWTGLNDVRITTPHTPVLRVSGMGVTSCTRP